MTDRVAQALDLLIQQYRESPNVVGLISAPASELSVADETITDLLSLYNIDDSVGAQLDMIGRIVQMPRPFADPDTSDAFAFDGGMDGLGFEDGRFASLDIGPGELLDDVLYRRLIRAKIIVNVGDATVEDLTRFMSFAFDIIAQVFEGPAFVTMHLTRPLGTFEKAIFDDLVPVAGGVGLIHVTNSADGEEAFTFAGDTGGTGFASTTDSDLATDGFASLQA